MPDIYLLLNIYAVLLFILRNMYLEPIIIRNMYFLKNYKRQKQRIINQYRNSKHI